MGGVAKTVGRVGSGVLTLGGSEIARNNLNKNSAVNRLLNAPGTILTGGADGSLSGVGGQASPYVAGPFSLDPAQLAADQANIASLGKTQYDTMNNFAGTDMEARKAARSNLADALTKQSQASFQQGLPATLEDLNARHLLNGSGVGQELARQQGNIATNIANQVGTLGANDIDQNSAARLSALQGLQGNQTSGLQRQLGLEDFINQANVAKTIGAQMAPQVNNGKANTGTALQGGASLLQAARAFK